MYDKAVRVRVASRRDLLLTDTTEFADLHIQWIFYGEPASEPRVARRFKRAP